MTKRQHELADEQIDKAAADIARTLDRLLSRTVRLDDVAQDYVVEMMLFELVKLVVRFADKRVDPGSATIRLSNALLDYRDALFRER